MTLSSSFDTGTLVETSAGLAIYNTVRDHPLATFLVVLGLIVCLVLLTVYVVRRVKREAREYYDTGRGYWSRLRLRSTSRRHDELTGSSPSPSNVHEIRHARNKKVV
jgi:hypothetical protein